MIAIFATLGQDRDGITLFATGGHVSNSHKIGNHKKIQKYMY